MINVIARAPHHAFLLFFALGRWSSLAPRPSPAEARRGATAEENKLRRVAQMPVRADLRVTRPDPAVHHLKFDFDALRGTEHRRQRRA